VVGGFDAEGHSTDTVLVYNPTTDTWGSAHPLPYGVNHNSAAVAGGELYSFGAGGGELFVYNQNTDSWAARASSHYVHGHTAAVGVIDNKIYVAGGTGTPSQRELEVYDPAANTWTVKAPMSVARNHCAGGVINGKFYVVGGRASDFSGSTDALEVYNPQTNTWSTLVPMPTARSGLAAAVVDNELWVFGGEDVLEFVVHAEVEVYNPATNSWRQLPDMPAGGRHGIWASVIGNKIYIPGGGTGPGGSASNTNQIFTVTSTPAAFFTGEVPLSNGVYYLQLSNGNVFGYYSYLNDPRWIYHFDMGYEYWFDANDGHSGIYFYDLMSSHFFYTSPSFPFPYLYDFSLNTVLYYFPDPNNPGHYTTNPRYFYNFATGQIITM
jgi:N-acetylneuraminic acid mutarotase